MKSVFLLLLIIISANLGAQTSTDFQVNANACKAENLKITNLSVGPISQEWDFCESDLLVQPQLSSDFSLANVSGLVDLRVKSDDNLWYSFVCDADGNKLIKLAYGSSLENTPIQSTVAPFLIPSGIDIIEIGGRWYGLLGTFSQAKLYLLEFGNSLSNNPTINQVQLPDNPFNGIRSIRIVREGTSYIALVANFNAPRITRINFGTQLSTSPISYDFINVPGSSLLVGLDNIETSDGNKYLFASSFGTDQLFRLSFGMSWSGAPAIDYLNTGPYSFVNPTGLDIEYEGENFFLFSILNSGRLYRINFGQSLSTNGVIDDLGVFSDMVTVWGMDLVRHFGSYAAIFSKYGSNNKIYKIYLKDSNCSASIDSDQDFDPPLVSFANSGQHVITLRNYFSDKIEVQSYPTLVSSYQSPDIIFNASGNCVSHDLIFNVTSISNNIINYLWSFGDIQTSNDPNPTHKYATAGEYNVQLNVEATNGCRNLTEKTIKIYDPPAPSFTSPSGLICTNNEFTFANSTNDNFDGYLTYQWYVNNVLESTARDFKYAFSSGGDKNIKLVTSIPGCSNEQVQTISNVQSGPIVGFDVSGKCEAELISFANKSSGDIAGYEWSFGNGATSIVKDPQFQFSSEGQYVVTLKTAGTNGCISTTSQNLQIYSKPETNFSLDLPPFSCAGTPSQFHDTTPAMTDSNVASWSWKFGDVANGTASAKNPTYTYAAAGNYSVSLTATTNYGCSNSIQKTISIQPSPVAAFENTLACLNQGVQFTNTSAGIKASQWKIGAATYSTKNPPTQKFSLPGNYPVQLTVTGNNDCTNTFTKNVFIATPPTLNFDWTAPCVNNQTKFVNTSSGGNDPATVMWDFPNAIAQGAQATYSTPGTNTVTMSLKGQSGCVYTLNKDVIIENSPVADFSASDVLGKAPLIVDFVNMSSPADLSYAWSFLKNGRAIGNDIVKNPIYTFGETGDYAAELTVKNLKECIAKKSLPIKVVVPSYNVVMSDFRLVSATDGSRKAEVTLWNKSNIPVVDPEVVLDVSGGPLIKETIKRKIMPDQVVTQNLGISIIPRSLTYACAECLLKDDIELFNNIKCITLTEDDILFIPYPNPVQNQLSFDWISTTTDEAHVMIYNARGEKIFDQRWDTIITGLNKLSVPTESWGNGVYFLTFSQNGENHTFRFVVARE